jgi:hypothetical protein
VHQHLFRLLWEDVNNMGTRAALAGSLGFCPEHTWQFYHLADTLFSGEAGIAIIYQDLVRYLARRLQHAGACPPKAARERRWWQPGWERLRAALGLRLSESTCPTRSCPACACGEACEKRNLEWLVEGCLDPAFRPLYEASDGLCLPHLRQALALAEHTHPEVAHLLACAAVQRLEALASNLGEYTRKHAWKYRHERITREEQTSVYRTSWFLGGMQRRAPEPDQPDAASQNLTLEHLKQMGLRIDE